LISTSSGISYAKYTSEAPWNEKNWIRSTSRKKSFSEYFTEPISSSRKWWSFTRRTSPAGRWMIWWTTYWSGHVRRGWFET